MADPPPAAPAGRLRVRAAPISSASGLSPELSLFLTHFHHTLCFAKPTLEQLRALRSGVASLLDVYESSLLLSEAPPRPQPIGEAVAAAASALVAEGRSAASAKAELRPPPAPEAPPPLRLSALRKRRSPAAPAAAPAAAAAAPVPLPSTPAPLRLSELKRRRRSAPSAAAARAAVEARAAGARAAATHKRQAAAAPAPPAKRPRPVPEAPMSPGSASESDDGTFYRLPSGASGSAPAPAPPASLLGMPLDVQTTVLSFLGVREHLSAELVCRQLLSAGRYTSSWAPSVSLTREFGVRAPADVHAVAAMLFRRCLGRLVSLDLSGCFMADTCLGALSSMPLLRNVVAEGNFSRPGFAALARLPLLERLDLFTDRLGPGCVSELRRLGGLRDLALRGAALGADALGELAALPPPPALAVWLDGTAAAAAALAGVGTPRTVRALQLTVGMDAGDGAVSSASGPAAVRSLAAFGGLASLDVACGADAGADAAAWAVAAAALAPSLERLAVHRGRFASPAALAALAPLVRLRELRVAVPARFDGGAAACHPWWAALRALVAALPALRRVELHVPPVPAPGTRAALACLADANAGRPALEVCVVE